MTGLSEVANPTSGTPLRPEAGQNRGHGARFTEVLTKLSVIGILGLAGQQSISGYQAVNAGQAIALDEHAPVIISAAPGELVFAPTGSPSSASVITVADAAGHASTITIDAAGSVVID